VTGPYSRTIEHLALTFDQDSPVYAGAFELAIAAFPAYSPTEIAQDVMKQRRVNAELLATPVFRSPIIIDPALIVDIQRLEREKEQKQNAKRNHTS
jgi:hypothetical protein